MYFMIATSVILFSGTYASQSSSKQCYGPDYTEFFPFYGIASDVCTNAYYDSSETNSLMVTLSFGDVVYGEETFTDTDPAYNEKTICDPTFPAPIEIYHSCSLCLGFDDVFLSDDWARICPKYILECKNQFTGHIKKEYPTPCFTVGDDADDDIAQIVGGTTDFTLKLFKTNALTKDIVTDLFVAPFSISNSLIMTMMAAQGETLRQLMDAFELETSDYAIFDSYDTLIQSLQHKTEQLTNTIDNKLWINSNWFDVISPKFLEDFARFGEIESMDFLNESEIETQRIDSEIESLTHDLIKQPLSGKNLSSSTVLLFGNAMYLKGKWLNPFTQTVSETFTDDNNDKFTIDMMMMDAVNIRQYNDSEVEVFELPLDDDFSDISFIMIRPTMQKYIDGGPTSTISFEETMDRVTLDKWLNGLQEINYTQQLMLPFLEMYNFEDLTASLKSMGIVDMFDPKRADLTNLTVPHYQVYETDLNRQDYLKITQDGIELASFVTDGEDGKADAKNGPVEHADLPFIFFVMDRSVNLILYGGRVTNPRGWMIVDGDSGHKKHGASAGKIILIMMLVAAAGYFICKFAYNVTVMQLSGIEAIPHIQQFRDCVAWCKEKMAEVQQGANDDVVVPSGGSGPKRYAKLINDNGAL